MNFSNLFCFLFLFSVLIVYANASCETNSGDECDVGLNPCQSYGDHLSQNDCGICRNSEHDNSGCMVIANYIHSNGETCRTDTTSDALSFQEFDRGDSQYLVCIVVKIASNGEKTYVPAWKSKNEVAGYFQNGDNRYSPFNAMAGTKNSAGEKLDCTCGTDLQFSVGGGAGVGSKPPNIVGAATCWDGDFSSHSSESGRIGGRWYSSWDNAKHMFVHVGYKVISNNAFYNVAPPTGSSQITGKKPMNWIYRYTGGDISSAAAWDSLDDWEPLPFNEVFTYAKPPAYFAPGVVAHGFMVVVPKISSEHWAWVIQGFKYCITPSGCGGHSPSFSECASDHQTNQLLYHTEPLIANQKIYIKSHVYNNRATANSNTNPDNSYFLLVDPACSQSKDLTSGSTYYRFSSSSSYQSNSNDWPSTCGVRNMAMSNTHTRMNTLRDARHSWFQAWIPCTTCTAQTENNIATGLITFDVSEVAWKITPVARFDVPKNNNVNCGGSWTGVWFGCCDPSPTCSSGQEISSTCECVPCSERACGGTQNWDGSQCKCVDCTPVSCWSSATPSASQQCDAVGDQCKYRNNANSVCECPLECSYKPCSGDRVDNENHLPPKCRTCKTCDLSQATLCANSLGSEPTNKWVVDFSGNEPVCTCPTCEDYYISNPNESPANFCPPHHYYNPGITKCNCASCKTYLWDGRVVTKNNGELEYWPNANGECLGTYEVNDLDFCSPCIECTTTCPPGEISDPDYKSNQKRSITSRPLHHKLSHKSNHRSKK